MEPDERLIKEMVVASLGSCVTCNRPFDADSITILGHQENLWFLMLVCRECNSHGLVAALMKDNETSVVTDLTPEEAEKLTAGIPVSADDVLGIHEFLRDFDGDFSRLFRPSRDG
jgi:hypothetical protein